LFRQWGNLLVVAVVAVVAVVVVVVVAVQWCST
jgi:hypothetical protein